MLYTILSLFLGGLQGVSCAGTRDETGTSSSVSRVETGTSSSVSRVSCRQATASSSSDMALAARKLRGLSGLEPIIIALWPRACLSAGLCSSHIHKSQVYIYINGDEWKHTTLIYGTSFANASRNRHIHGISTKPRHTTRHAVRTRDSVPDRSRSDGVQV